jgi:hypothetical protein
MERCSICFVDFKNKKSLSNHLRYGCNGILETDEVKRLSEWGKLYYQKNRLGKSLANIEREKQYLCTENGMRVKLARNKQIRLKYPEKEKARNTLRNAIKGGYIKRCVCEVCGNPKTQAHHDDYSKPLEVRWLCHQHHCELEGRWIPRN